MFSEIDRHLDRLNESVDRATTQAMSFLSYKLRTQDTLDRLLTIGIDRLRKADPAEETAMPLMPGPLLSESRLPPYQARKAPMTRVAIRKPSMTLEQKALIQLRRLMKSNREVSSARVVAFLDKHFGDRQQLSSDEISIVSIQDYCLFVFIGRLALLSRQYPSEGRKAHPQLRPFRDYQFESIAGEQTDNDFLRVPRFVVSRRNRGVTHAA